MLVFLTNSKVNKMKICLLISLLYFATILCKQLNAQEADKKVSVGIEGMIAASTDLKGAYLTFGGPNIKLTTKYFNIGFGFCPSLRFQDDQAKSFVTPTLGFGPQLYIGKSKRILFNFPFYYTSSSNKWTFTAGIGYSFTKKKA